jgi:small subunit ribosomal protein S2
MALPEFSMRQLLEAGVHFGHQKHRWNPLMSPYIYGDRNNIHILDLTQTVPMLHEALTVVRDTVAGGGRVLFVGTKRQASEPIAEAARASAQYYINHRWLGGTLTNWKTISNSIQRLRQLSEQLAEGAKGLTKKERLKLDRELGKLELSLGGIKDMGGVPDIVIVIDTNKEALALQEAKKLRIPIVAVVDTNCDPSLVDYAIPGNDDASRAIALYCDLFARAILDGLEQASIQAGVDLGAMDEPDVSLPELEAVEGGESSLEVSDAAEENGSDESEQKV